MSVKRLIIVCFLLVSRLASNAQSEQGHHELAIGAGYLSAQDIWYQSLFKGSLLNKNNPIIAADYVYYVSDRCALGVGAGIHKNNYTVFIPRTYFIGTDKVEKSYYATTVCAEVKIVYTDWRNVQYYGNYALGIVHNETFPHSAYRLSVQLTPIAFRFGRTHGLFFELGMGYKGMFHGGYSLRLGSHMYKHKVIPVKDK